MLAHGFEDVGECPPGASGHERADGLGHAERVDGPLPRCFLVSELEVELGLLDVQKPGRRRSAHAPPGGSPPGRDAAVPPVRWPGRGESRPRAGAPGPVGTCPRSPRAERSRGAHSRVHATQATLGVEAPERPVEPDQRVALGDGVGARECVGEGPLRPGRVAGIRECRAQMCREADEEDRVDGLGPPELSQAAREE